MNDLKTLLAALAVTVLPALANAQGAEVAFGGLEHDTTLPVEMAADSMKIDQSAGTALLTGNVVVGQGEMRLSAAEVLVEYETENGDATGRIKKVTATGGVTLVNGAEAAEAERAEYSIEDGIVVLTGNVVLTQGQNALSSDKMTVDLNTGVGLMEGRVRSILQPGSGQ